MAEADAPKNKGMERVKGMDLYLLLEVEVEADVKTIKKAYRWVVSNRNSTTPHFAGKRLKPATRTRIQTTRRRWSCFTNSLTPSRC
jgi:hypothetical protein